MLEEIRRRTDTEYKEIDNICYQHLDSVYSAKKSSNSIENIDYLVDRALAKNKISSHYDKVRTRCPKIKLQRHKVNRKSLSIARKKALAVILSVIILSVALIPIITSISSDEGLPADIDILNVQSYPVIGGNWVVKFTTIGCDNLTITAVNGTKWSNVSKNYDLKFLGLKRGNEILEYEWMNDSVFIANYSSKETTYEVSQVFTPGVHTLMFQFGDHVAFANNLALEYWLQTTTSDFNNGTINNINVSSDAFHLNETFYLRNTSLIDDESFEGSWPPSGWSETGNWNRENNQAYDGSWSADFDGLGGGRSGDLDSPTMDCSDTVNITAIYVDFYYRDEGAESGEFVLYYYDGSGWDYIEDLADDLENNWNHYTGKIIDSQYFKNNFQIRWSAIGVDNGEHVYVDLVNVTLEKNISGYVTSGSLISEAHNTTRKVPMYNSITVDNSTPGGASIATWIRAADTQANLSSATWYTDISQVPYEMWVQWRINLTGNEDNTSTVNEVNLSWNYDDEKPTSSVDVISPYWQNTTPLTINATVLDTGGSGLNNVTLYWYNSTDNSTWSGPWNYGTDSASPWSWSFNFTMTNGTGYYRFYSIARDNESNVEDFTGNDTSCGYDNVKPSSVVDDISPYWYNDSTSPLTINVSSATDDLSGVKNVTLYYRFREDNGSGWGSWTSYSVDESLPWSWSFNFPDSTGHYQFYSIATDNTSNKEDPPVTPDNDTYCGFNSTKPTSEVDTISPYWQSISPLPITAQATDYTGTGLKNVTLYYYNSTDNSTWYGNWTFGVDTDPWNGISWSFNFPNSSGYYRFYSIAIDNNSNIEYFTGNDTICGYDTAKPSSQVDPISPYWQNSSDNPLTITVTGPSDDLSVKNISLNYRYRADNGSGWNSWTSYGVDENSPWSWSFNFPYRDGHYQI